jgi:uncharacterized protein (TIGR02145 family)
MKNISSCARAIFGIALIFTLSCSGGDDGDGGSSNSGNNGTFIDDRDGKSYKWVKIGEQVWMAENLNYNPGTNGSKCYKNEDAKCEEYGRLYDWNTSKEVCPEGWRLSGDDDWNILMKLANPSCEDYHNCADAATKLKATSGWKSYSGVPAGTDDFGFKALPGGMIDYDGSSQNGGEYGHWWTASVDAYTREIAYYYDYVARRSSIKASMLSVRCIQN